MPHKERTSKCSKCEGMAPAKSVLMSGMSKIAVKIPETVSIKLHQKHVLLSSPDKGLEQFASNLRALRASSAEEALKRCVPKTQARARPCVLTSHRSSGFMALQLLSPTSGGCATFCE